MRKSERKRIPDSYLKKQQSNSQTLSETEDGEEIANVGIQAFFSIGRSKEEDIENMDIYGTYILSESR